METRETKARELLPAVEYLGNGAFTVPTVDPDEWYNATLTHCKCADFRQGNLCKHIIAVRLWYGNANIYDRAKAVIANRVGFTDGQTIELARTRKARVYLVNNNGLIFLVAKAITGNRSYNVRAGMLDPITFRWTFTLTKSAYNHFSQDAKSIGE